MTTTPPPSRTVLPWAMGIAAEAERLRKSGMHPRRAWEQAAGVGPDPDEEPLSAAMRIRVRPSRARPRGPLGRRATTGPEAVTRAAILAWFAGNPKPITTPDLALAIGIEQSTLRRTLAREADRGVVRRVGQQPPYPGGPKRRPWLWVSA